MTCDHRNVKWRRRDIRYNILVLRGCGIMSKSKSSAKGARWVIGRGCAGGGIVGVRVAVHHQ